MVHKGNQAGAVAAGDRQLQMASFDLQQSYQAPTLLPITSSQQSPVPATSSLSPDQTYAKSVAADIVSLTATTVSAVST
jgi:hypothetical protein